MPLSCCCLRQFPRQAHLNDPEKLTQIDRLKQQWRQFMAWQSLKSIPDFLWAAESVYGWINAAGERGVF